MIVCTRAGYCAFRLAEHLRQTDTVARLWAAIGSGSHDEVIE